ncbi:pyruvate, water dikinase [Saccharopolyspora kobensis]|uniref:Pyruvate, water dikinase n=1 Tax=Saccharopolyspora kobensis TaxID=146035 RepID=A0A1H6EFW9_9PSEU|nr:PEP/pyruvate-binding domain-containing protein [Saccharopolyspora kobensis]SEG96163.1 pyruvate, water dikinase [Saccharopolyspora kobensis]SFD21742.1 pyruvate, water dikinase [Saccharopolyspora kobensis]
MEYVVPLRGVGRGDLASAGGKGANLGELVNAGFAVPDGFVITTEAYAEVAAGLVTPEDAAALRAEFDAVEVPDELREAIVSGYAELGSGPVAVRSSATAEDLPGAAFAGQQDTYLNVVGEAALLDAVRRCWGSLWTDRAIAYREKRGISPAEVRIAVVVQRMVDAEFAGVLFTANPVTGDRRQLVVDASSGLGEAVVSGLVTPDHYVLSPGGQVAEWSPGRREVVLRSAAGGGVTRQTGAAVERLPGQVLAELARIGTRVAEHFGRPQDIEWACVAGRVLLLQARPMTALPPPPLRLNRRQRKVGSVLLEYVPYRPYPIDMSTWVPHGPVGLMAEVTGAYGIRGAFDGFLPEVDGVVDRLVPPSPRPSLGVVKAPFKLLAKARRYDPARWTEDPRFIRFRAGVRELAARDLAALPWSQLVRMPRRALGLVAPIAELRIDYLPATGLSLVRLFVALKLIGRAELLGELIAGAPTRTSDANRALEGLAARARANPRLREAVDGLDPAELTDFPEFHAEFTAFLAEYGHRETETPVLVTPPTWGESPETVLRLVAVLAAGDPKPTGHADRAMEQLRGHRIRRWVQRARDGVAFREDSHFYFTMPQPILRRSLLEIGRRLVGAGSLDEPEEVFHLRLEELEAVDEPAAGARLRELVAARAARREELAGVRLIDPNLVFPREEHGDALASGTPASGGRATGPARIIREPAEFSRLNSGDVLVCRYTNPSWTPLFQRAAAVVVDSGGPASHAAIVAREYGIPAVMGTADGTSAITDGLTITVDGDTGRVVPEPESRSTAPQETVTQPSRKKPRNARTTPTATTTENPGEAGQ